MKRVFVLAVVMAAVAVASAFGATREGAQVREVSIPGKVFVPGRLDVLVGDTVLWRNGDAASHTVTANDDSFDSGFLGPGGTFARTFAKPGLYAYHCTIHKFMRGVVRVVPVALTAPDESVLSGGRIVLQGLAPAGTLQVVLAEVGGSSRERRITPAADGSFSVPVRVFGPTAFRAVAGGLSSPPVRIRVAPRVRVQPGAGGLAGAVTPSRAGARAVLQRYDRERFAWITVAHGVVDRSSHVAVPLPAEHAGHFRVVVRGSDGWADGISQTVVGR
jgi:plastocyanin